MQILEPGQTDRPRCDAGMTLIELLVVVTVVSILTVGVAIVMGRGPSAPAARDTAQFLEAWRLQSDLARQSHVPTALRVDPTGWHSMRLGATGWLATSPQREWQGRVALTQDRLMLDGVAPTLVFLPSGQSTPFSATFASGAAGSTRACSGDGWAKPICE